MTYHITGSIMAALFGLTIYGLWCQLEKILSKKKELHDAGETSGATSIISLNYIASAFLAFYLMFFYGFALERFNHYIVWPRLAAIVVTVLILREMWIDRRDSVSTRLFFSSVVATVTALLILLFDRNLATSIETASGISLMLIAVLMGQANIHQISLILKSGSTGSIALRAHQMTLLKDIGTVAFGFAMGKTGWPLIVLCGSDAVFKLSIMYLFYWVRTSDLAQSRRESFAH